MCLSTSGGARDHNCWLLQESGIRIPPLSVRNFFRSPVARTTCSSMGDDYGMHRRRGGRRARREVCGDLPVVGDDRKGHEAQEDRHECEDHRSVHLHLPGAFPRSASVLSVSASRG